MDERIDKTQNLNIEYSFKALEHSIFEYSNYSLATLLWRREDDFALAGGKLQSRLTPTYLTFAGEVDYNVN